MSPALLAPVPEEHLVSGQATCVEVGKVAFGSRAFQVFRDIEALAAGEPIEAYLYASHSSKFGPPKVRWKALYIGHVESAGGAHPQGATFRPASTEKYGGDSSGHWAIFWEVTDLKELSKSEAIPISSFRGWDKKKHYVSAFVPEGPLIVEAP